MALPEKPSPQEETIGNKPHAANLPQDAPLNHLAIACLESMRQSDYAPFLTADDYLDNLHELQQDMRHSAIFMRANRIWALYDEAALVAILKRLNEAEGYSDTSHYEYGYEAWSAACLMATADASANPPVLPTFSRAAVQHWLESHG